MLTDAHAPLCVVVGERVMNARAVDWRARVELFASMNACARIHPPATRGLARCGCARYLATQIPGVSHEDHRESDPMKTRHVFSTPDLASARRVIAAARALGVANDNISLIARSDIEMETIPDNRLDASTDVVPAAVRGVGVGGAVGLVAGIAAIAIPAIGITVAGAGLITLLGAAIGGWSSALAGSSFPNAVRQTFESEIEAGRILVVIDVERALAAAVDDACTHEGAAQLPFDHPSALE